MSYLEKILAISDDRHGYIREWKKKTGRKVIGHFCINTPEELIDAAGMLPVRLTSGMEPARLVDEYIQSNVCSFARSSFELGLNGTLDYLDGVIIPHTCDIITKMFDFWRMFISEEVFLFNIPHKVTAECRVYMEQEMKKMSQWLEEKAGKAIDQEALQNSIKEHNQTRQLLKAINEQKAQGRLTSSQLIKLLLAVSAMPKQESNILLQGVLDELNTLPVKNGFTPLFLTGSVCEDVELIEILEESGAVVTNDDNCIGTRYFWYPVDEKVEALEALSERYMSKVLCPRSYQPGERLAYIKERIKEGPVKGAILYTLSCCDCHQFEYPGMQKGLEDLGIPTLHLETNYETREKEQIKTRVEAFLEMIGGQ